MLSPPPAARERDAGGVDAVVEERAVGAQRVLDRRRKRVLGSELGHPVTLLAPHLTAFLRERLPRERQASPHTCEAYAYAFQLLLAFASKRLRATPSWLTLEQLDVPLALAFLDDLETARGNSARTRNARLAAIKSFARLLEFRVPSCVQQAHGLLAIPFS